MSDDVRPTAVDLARDLRAYLADLGGRDGRDYAWLAAARRALAAEAEVARLRGLIERDRTGLVVGLVKVLRAVRSRDWLRRIGEWGSYSYEQRTVSTLREEINGCLGEIEAAAEAALRQSGNLSRHGVAVTDDDGEAD